MGNGTREDSLLACTGSARDVSRVGGVYCVPKTLARIMGTAEERAVGIGVWG